MCDKEKFSKNSLHQIYSYFLFFFTVSPGQQYWMLRQLEVEEGFPRNISHLGFPSRITSVDAALHLRNDHITVFFTGHECWRYRFTEGAVLEEMYQTLSGDRKHIEWRTVSSAVIIQLQKENYAEQYSIE